MGDQESSFAGAKSSGKKTLISVTDLVHRITALEHRVKALEDQNQQQQITIAQLTSSSSHTVVPQYASTLWGATSPPISVMQPITTTFPLAATIQPGSPAASSVNRTNQNPLSTESERNLVQAIKEVQQQTGNTHPERSVVSQHMIYMGTQDKYHTFKAICRSAERKGLIEMQANEGGGPSWITLKKQD